MINDLNHVKNTSKELEIVHQFEFDLQKFGITLHTIITYCEKILGSVSNKLTSDKKRIKKIAKRIENEFKNSEQINRMKSVLFAMKYDELASYFLFKRGTKTNHGNIYVVSDKNIIKTVYKSEFSGWFSQHLKTIKISPRKRFKLKDKILRATRRESVSKARKKKGQ